MIDAGVPGYGRFGVLSRVELERFCYLDDVDRRLIAARRRDYNRLGFAVQVVTVRYLGMFLTDPIDVPAELVAYLGEQLEIDDPSCLGEYVVRRTTRFEHQAEIAAEYGLVGFAEAEAELAAWIADQAWITGDGPTAIFEGAGAGRCRLSRYAPIAFGKVRDIIPPYSHGSPHNRGPFWTRIRSTDSNRVRGQRSRSAIPWALRS
ncbi:DUF4158 domain-containing protein [Nocardia sp. 2YAB30]|uniref:DUF4158 domain-containing protein n=1 Tax=unclassified Nocardia TaxID=2637762 RepID=UPI003F949CDC